VELGILFRPGLQTDPATGTLRDPATRTLRPLPAHVAATSEGNRWPSAQPVDAEAPQLWRRSSGWVR
jgi:hypothetical protein